MKQGIQPALTRLYQTVLDVLWHQGTSCQNISSVTHKIATIERMNKYDINKQKDGDYTMWMSWRSYESRCCKLYNSDYYNNLTTAVVTMMMTMTKISHRCLINISIYACFNIYSITICSGKLLAYRQPKEEHFCELYINELPGIFIFLQFSRHIGPSTFEADWNGSPSKCLLQMFKKNF